MISILAKIVDRTDPGLVEQAEAELQEAHFSITCRAEGDFLTVDTSKHGGPVNEYPNAVIIVGKKTV